MEQWLQSMADLSGKSCERLLQNVERPEELLELEEGRLSQILPPGQLKIFSEGRRTCGTLQKVKENYERLKEKKIRFVGRSQAEYPERLKQIPDPPMGLYYRGELPRKDVLSVAIVGSRDCSVYGENVAANLGTFLGARGIQVISGMARGIDGISQQAALLAGGTSFGVLGCGVDICYPKTNQKLYEELSERGGILSTYPPGTMPLARYFPPRNRIVSGLADALVVVEARLKSGTLITVDMALEQGKDVFAVPGRVTDRLSDGCNKLLKQGAEVYTDPEVFLEEMEQLAFLKKIAPGTAAREYLADVKGPQGELRPIWEQLDETPKSAEEIAALFESRYSIREINVQLMQLTLEGFARQVTSGHFCRT